MAWTRLANVYWDLATAPEARIRAALGVHPLVGPLPEALPPITDEADRAADEPYRATSADRPTAVTRYASS